MSQLTTLNSKIEKVEEKVTGTKAAEALPLVSPAHKEEAKEEPKPPSTPKQTTAIEHYHNCPGCHATINAEARKELEPEIRKELEPAILKEAAKKHLSIKNPVICKDCGEIVDGKEPKCSNCGGTEARKL